MKRKAWYRLKQSAASDVRSDVPWIAFVLECLNDMEKRAVLTKGYGNGDGSRESEISKEPFERQFKKKESCMQYPNNELTLERMMWRNPDHFLCCYICATWMEVGVQYELASILVFYNSAGQNLSWMTSSFHGMNKTVWCGALHTDNLYVCSAFANAIVQHIQVHLSLIGIQYINQRLDPVTYIKYYWNFSLLRVCSSKLVFNSCRSNLCLQDKMAKRHTGLLV